MATSTKDDLPPLVGESDEANRLSCSDDDEADDAGDDWNEMDQENEPVQCLFCESVADSVEAAILHLANVHAFHLNALKEKFNMDQYSYIKMINYIRTHKSTAESVIALTEQPWNDDKYLKPVQVEPWLMFDFEDVDSAQPATLSNEPQTDAHQIGVLQRQLQEKDAVIAQLFQQIEQMKGTFHDLIERTTETKPTTSKSKSLDTDVPSVGQVPIADDTKGYFSTYSHYDIHHAMLSDKVRTDSYRDAILRNGQLFAGKSVLDVGCGTSILSMFASRAGADRVIAIDQSHIIYYAMDIVNRNKVPNIEFVKGRLEDTEIPQPDKVDIIVSEWMGYFLLFEGMLDSIIYARDHHLKENGIILPNRCNISLVGFGDEVRHREFVAFWEDVYGFDMSPLQPDVLKETIIEVCNGEHVLTEPVIIAEFDMMTVDYSCSNFVYDFQMAVKKSGKITAFVGYFDTFFDLPEAIKFTTGPHSTPTHWKQSIFYIRTPVSVTAGEVVQGKIFCRRGVKDLRSLNVEIHVFGETHKYALD